MQLKPITPKISLNKAFLKQRPLRSEIDLFKKELAILINASKHHESEEHHKNNVSDFLKKAIYKDQYAINTKGKQDLVIHSGNLTKTPVAVIIEAKRPSNKADWFTAEKPNAKALQELVLYYMRERVEEKNNNIQYLIATNINEWFIIEAKHFEHLFYENKKFLKEYCDWRDGKKVTKDTDLFYKEIAKAHIDSILDEIPCTFFKLDDYKKVLLNENEDDDKALVELYKILSPQHLLKVPFANDSNELDERFYKELLHIIGLEEVKDAGKNIIRRKKDNRDNGSLIELTIQKLKTEGLDKVPDKRSYGENLEDQQFNVALELCITWINRVLFLKLLEGQLMSYHNGDKAYKFLHHAMVQDFDELYELFHEVLAVNIKDRETGIKDKYARVPYLNSSLFEISELESNTLRINALSDSKTIVFPTFTVLKDLKAKNANSPTLTYFFQFLDAYDFSGEGAEGIQEDQKTLINAAVLGKVFEKINGYKDGSIYTPAFITMYMCRQTIRLAVVEKFNSIKHWNVANFEDLYNKIDDIKEANDIINDLKICDPAVGSGHFLVSALNEILVIKSELRILQDKNGKRLKEYHFEIQNDELIVTDENGSIINYNPNNKESQRVQETLFTEKQTIIENCLFGVDINPNSVKICRLRLWIELLKNAYYKSSLPSGEGRVAALETLPNIDINIKCGNSLLSRFGLAEDLSKALKSIKYDIKAYRGFVQDYKNCKDREAKKGLQLIIDSIKGDFRTEIEKNDPKKLKLSKLGGELYNLTSQTFLFEEDAKLKKVRLKKIAKLEPEIKKITREIEEIKNNAIYKNAFEWRFEFPEVLDNEGNFEGFDVVIGNPPYIQLQSMGADADALSKANYETYTRTGDIYSLFYELGNWINKANGYLSFITSNKWMRADYGLNTRKYIAEKTNPLQLIDFGMALVFDNATVLSNILMFQKAKNKDEFSAVRTPNNYNNKTSLDTYFNENNTSITVGENAWVIQDKYIQVIKSKVEKQGVALKDWDIKINYGVKTGFNEAFIIDEKTKDALIAEDAKSAEILKPILRGQDIKAWQPVFANLWLINSHNGVKDIDLKRIDVENDYPAIHKHLLQYEKEITKRSDKGDTPFNLRNCAYIDDFNKPKIMYPNMTKFLPFMYDANKGYICNDKGFIITADFDLKYLTAFLNTKLFKFCFKDNFPDLLGDTLEVRKVFFEQIPVKQISIEEQAPFITLVDEILGYKAAGKDSSDLELRIDEMVYALYDLSPEEIAMIKK